MRLRNTHLTDDKDSIPSLIADHMSESFHLNEVKTPKELFRTKAKNGGEFVVYKRDVEGAGKQDAVAMFLVKNGKVEKKLGSHVSVDGAKKFAKNHNLI